MAGRRDGDVAVCSVFLALRWWAIEMEQSTVSDGSDNKYSPEKRLEVPNSRLVKSGINTIPDMEPLRECVAHENTLQNWTQILRPLK